jgi:pyruvate carboxylase subunit B
MGKKVVDLIDATFSDNFYETYGFISKDNLFSSFKAASKANIKYMEIGGNIAFLSSIYYLGEAAFSDFDLIREHIAEDVNLQVATYSMGGFSSEFLDYELLNKFAAVLSTHQITTVRNFDPLNSLNNIDFSSHIYEQNGLLTDITLVLHNGYTDMKHYIAFLEELRDSYMMFNSISIMDPFGTASPTFIYELVTLAKEILGEAIYISLGIKNSTSTAILSYVSAIDAGIDALYLSNNIANYAYSYPDMLTMINLGKDLNFIFNQIEKKDIIDYKNILKRVVDKIPLKNKKAPTNEAYEYLVPLDELEFFRNKILNSHDEDLIKHKDLIFKEFDEIVGILNLQSITKPFSNNIFSQAMNNIKYGKWEKIDESFIRNILYNKELFNIKSDILVKIIDEYADFDFYTNSYQETIDKLLKNKNTIICDETIIIATISEILDEKVDIFNEIKEEVFHIKLGAKEYILKIKEGSEELDILKAKDESSANYVIKAQKKGIIEEIKVLIGEDVIEGQVLMILKTKEEEIEVIAKFDGFVENIYVQTGEEVQENQKLLLLSV